MESLGIFAVFVRRSNESWAARAMSPFCQARIARFRTRLERRRDSSASMSSLNLSSLAIAAMRASIPASELRPGAAASCAIGAKSPRIRTR